MKKRKEIQEEEVEDDDRRSVYEDGMTRRTFLGSTIGTSVVVTKRTTIARTDFFLKANLSSLKVLSAKVDKKSSRLQSAPTKVLAKLFAVC